MPRLGLGEALALWRGPALADVTYEEFARPEVVRLEERHAAAIEQRTEVGLNPTGVAAGLGAVWVANSGEQTITRIDPRSGGTTTIDVHAEPTEIAVGGGAVWVTSADARTVSQLDPRLRHVMQVIDVGGGPSGIAVGHDAVWVANNLDGTVSRIAPRSAVVSTTIPIGNGAAAIAVAPDGVWVAEQFGNAVDRIDPHTNRLADRIVLGNRPSGLAVGGGSLWVEVRASDAAHRGGTLRLLGGTEGFDFLDPALAYATASGSLLSATGDGLTAMQRAAGRDGTQIVPDLAVTLPRPQDGGRTYRFVLRTGVHYSTGGVVRARDVRPSFERLWKLPPFQKATSPGGRTFFAHVVGAARCTRTPRTCDLSRGIVTEPGNDSVVTFHLTRADPDFLNKLALAFGFILPAGTPPLPADVRPVPATGPYMVAGYRPGHRLVLTRNPRFREWSQAAQPDGYPDRIELRLDVPESRRIDAVLRGEADYAGGVLSGVSPKRTEELLTQHAAQTQVEPLLTTIAVFLNTRVAPFDDPRVRRALAYGIDRRAVVRAIGGSSAGISTCQILPPNFPGYIRSCPYGAPDLRTARRLVAASGTRGMRVTVRTVKFLAAPVRGVVALLRRLGYHTSLKVSANGLEYSELVSDSRTRAQAGTFYWAADYPAASNFLQQPLSCAAFRPRSVDNLNVAELCSPAIDARMRRAARPQVVNPQPANRQWARADRAMVDAAPWVPLFNPRSVELLSRRAGGHRYSPIYGTLVDQLWVR